MRAGSASRSAAARAQCAPRRIARAADVAARARARVRCRCWGELLSSLGKAASPSELRAAHEAYLAAATRHCLLHPAGAPTASLISTVLALTLSLHRELCGDDDEGEGEGGAAGGAWAALVDASRRQFEMLLAALAQQPLAPRELLQARLGNV